MSMVAFGRTVGLVTARSTTRRKFRIGLEAIEKGTGRLSVGPDVQYDGDGVSFRRGDVLFGKLRPNLRKAWLADSDGDAVGDFHVYRPNPRLMTSRYLAYLVLSQPFLEPVMASVYGAKMPRADWGAVRNIKVWVPELNEQRAIADYLDRETAQIDAFIAKTEELIALLTERRAAVIARAVTRGLDENAEMKETGVATLGLIPAHWTVERIRNVGRAIIGLTYSPEDICDADDAGTLVLRAGNIQNGELVYEDCVYVGKVIPRALRLRLGDIVICARNGSARLIGKNAVATSEVVDQTWGAFMVVLRTPINEYLRWVLNSAIFTSSLGAFATSTINQLTSSTLHSLQFAMPPRRERAAISAYLTDATAATDNAIRAARRAIALARERRAALISAAVTGKIEIGAAA
ncbi:restriction endonuclease subunit S [Microbacterium paraoxydans]|uniref:restriction endonuclease subunit S n=1 Tax=Microbacterium paraoxydans TaxID=199592 RepID=UPI003D71F0C3